MNITEIKKWLMHDERWFLIQVVSQNFWERNKSSLSVNLDSISRIKLIETYKAGFSWILA